MSRAPVILLHTDAAETARAILAEAHGDLTVHVHDSYVGLDRMLAESRAEVVYTTRFLGPSGFPSAALLAAPDMRWISVGGSGTDHLQPWDATRLTVTNAAGVAADMIAEYALGMLLHFSLDLPGLSRNQSERRWDGRAKVEPIAGRTLLILGLGKTGQAMARRAKAMGMHTLGMRANPAPVAHVDEVHGAAALHDLLARADYTLVCVPLLPSTRGLLDRRAFAAIRPGSVLVDVSRGGVVDETALMEALSSGRLRGAALDVFQTEPLPTDHPLWGFGNVVISPHCSSVYDGWEAEAFRLFARNLIRYRRGEPLTNIVDPQRGY
ncbi:MAG: D-2-hydroxyacid dehydrogenase [Gemmobacter sp.]|jgi:phosphoglycerate dehydrogenase-like enzyme|nr:D-2-hydroxyacid dehydrogenase [Gemmobacter sp.]